MRTELLIRVAEVNEGKHVVTNLYVGVEGGTLAHAGTLTFRTGEFQIVMATLSCGERATSTHLNIRWETEVFDAWSKRETEKPD